jgi:4-hydroxy-tetrahydrodipicolinate reductase
MNDSTNSSEKFRIALVGYGQMGREIERLASERGIDVAARYTSHSPLGDEPVAPFEAAIEFSRPDAAVGNIERVLGWGKPIVVGTTGWLSRIDEVQRAVDTFQGRVIYGSNFSIGVNLFFKLVRQAGELFDDREMYDVAVHEIHHTRKADSPSGTAITTANILLEEIARKQSLLTDPAQGKIDPSALHVTSQRLGATIGTHIVAFDSEADTLELTHRAKNRSGFALGALLAAQWIVDKEPGIYRFEDIL